jgi:hypothetical protein
MAAQGQLIGYQTAMDARRDTSSVNLKLAVEWFVARIDAYADYRASATLARYAFKLRD